MRLHPFVDVDGLGFDLRPDELLRRCGAPQQRRLNAVALDEWDYGQRVLRFERSGRLEEVTVPAAVLHLGRLAVPLAALPGFVRAQDPRCFERAGFLVSPGLGLAFVPGDGNWLTALAAHALARWRAL